jgi:hypothetical protein
MNHLRKFGPWEYTAAALFALNIIVIVWRMMP